MSYSVVETQELPPTAVSVSPSPPPPQNPISSDKTCHGVQLFEVVDVYAVTCPTSWWLPLMPDREVRVDAKYRPVPRRPAENERSEDDGDSTQCFARPVLLLLLLLPAQSLGLGTRVAATVARHDEVPERRYCHAR